MTQAPVTYADVESCVDATIARVGRRILLGTPLGLGKANHLVNEFFRRACEDPRIDLRIFTALTLARPRWKSDLERRFLEPPRLSSSDSACYCQRCSSTTPR